MGYVEAITSYGRDIDNLIILIAVLVGFWWILSSGVFIWLIVRFRERPGVRPQYITGEEHHEARWIHWPHYLVLVCDVFIIWGAVQVWYDVKQHLPPSEETVRIIGQQWAWSFVHPGPDGKLDTADDIKTVDELYVKVNAVTHFQLEARDVLHNFSVPAFRLKQDAIPGRRITGWFQPEKTGSYDIQCAEICGIGHGIMAARVIIHDEQEHATWMAANAPTAPSTVLAAAGE